MAAYVSYGCTRTYAAVRRMDIGIGGSCCLPTVLDAGAVTRVEFKQHRPHHNTSSSVFASAGTSILLKKCNRTRLQREHCKMGIKGLAKLLSDEAPEVREMTALCCCTWYSFIFLCLLYRTYVHGALQHVCFMLVRFGLEFTAR